jgi:hypothetical protein
MRASFGYSRTQFLSLRAFTMKDPESGINYKSVEVTVINAGAGINATILKYNGHNNYIRPLPTIKPKKWGEYFRPDITGVKFSDFTAFKLEDYGIPAWAVGTIVEIKVSNWKGLTTIHTINLGTITP